MNAIAKPGMSRAEARERAADVGLRIAAYTDDAEQLRRLPPQALKVILDSGLTSLMRTHKYGGHEADWMSYLDVVAEVGQVSGSIGWCMSFLIAHQWFLHYYPEKTVEYVYGQDPDPKIVTSFAPFGRARIVPGGYVVSGDWSFGSGADHCDWAMVGAPVFAEENAPPVGFKTFLLKPGQFRIRDTWYSVGLKGSGSNNIVVEEAFVEEDFALDMAILNAGKAPGSLYNTGMTYRTPMINQFPLALYANAWAVARGALGSFLEFNKDRLGTITGAKMAETQALQIRVGEAAANIDAAYLICENLNGMVMRGELMHQTFRPGRDFGHATKIVTEAVDSLFMSAGARGLTESSPMQRHWRDIHAMCNHVALNPESGYQAYGRDLMGIPAPARH